MRPIPLGEGGWGDWFRNTKSQSASSIIRSAVVRNKGEIEKVNPPAPFAKGEQNEYLTTII